MPSPWAHPDDETFLAGGTIAAALDAGQRVVRVSAAAGESGTGLGLRRRSIDVLGCLPSLSGNPLRRSRWDN